MVSRSESFFHGTTAHLEPGEELLPGSKVGRGRGRSVWLATTVDGARSWAVARAMRDGHSEPDPNDPTGWANRPSVPVHVYEVEPHELAQDRNGYHKAAKAVVKRKVR